jgi:DNA polymerase elongation subunit (family B)
MVQRLVAAIDIETTGLDADDSRIRAVALVSRQAHIVIVDDDERALLVELEAAIEKLPRHAMLVSWNGEEFDFPFLRTRLMRWGIPNTLRLTRKNGVGKYGRPLYAVQWNQLPHVDIAPLFRDEAARLGVGWNLKPVARAVLGTDPVEIPRTGDEIAQTDAALLKRYVESDATITSELAGRILTDLVVGLGPTVTESA